MIKHLWSFTAVLLLLLALYVNAGRILLPMVDTAQQGINDWLSESIGIDAMISEPTGGWSGLSPDFRGESFVIKSVDGSTDALKTGRFVIKPDVVASLQERKFVFRKILVDKLELSLQKTALGGWQVAGLSDPAVAKQNDKADVDLDLLLNLMLYSRSLEMTNVVLSFLDVNGEVLSTIPADVLIENSGYKHYFTANVSLIDGQPSFSMLVEARGDPREPDEFSAVAYASLNAFNVSKLLPLFGVVNEKRDEYVPIDSEVWATWDHDLGLAMQGNLSVPEVPLSLFSKGMEPAREFSVAFSGHYRPELSWRFDAENILANWHDVHWHIGQLKLQASDLVPGLIKLSIDQFKLDDIGPVMSKIDNMPARLRDIIVTLNPKGTLKNIHLSLPTSQQSKDAFLLRANLDDVSNAAWHGAPGGTGVSGFIEMDLLSGYVDLDATNFALDFPGVYKQPLKFNKAFGQVAWNIDKATDKLYISSNTLHLFDDDGEAKAQFYLDIPTVKSEEDPLMYLSVGLTDVQAHVRDKYIPYFLSQNLLDWLSDSINAGGIKEAGFIYRGSLNKGASERRSVQLHLDIEDAALQYHPQWPALAQVDATVVVDNQYTDVYADKATIYNSNLSNIDVRLAPYGDSGGMQLEIVGELSGRASDGLRILRESPIRDSIGAALDSWVLDGDMAATIDLAIPLGLAGHPVKQEINVELAAGQLNMPDFDLMFENIDGGISFSDKYGLKAEKLAAKFWQQAVEIDIDNPLVSYGGSQKREILISMKGKSTVDRVVDWSKISLLQFLDGEFDYRAQFRIFADDPKARQRGHSMLTLYSDLDGAAVVLPEPLGKPREMKVPLHVKLPMGLSERNLHIRYGDQLDMVLTSRETGLYSGHAVVGGGFAEMQPSPGLLVSGEVPYFELKRWQEVLNRYQQYSEAAKAEDESFSLRLIDLAVGEFTIDEFSLTDVKAKVHREPDRWIVNATSPVLAGELHFFDNNLPYLFDMEYVRLPTSQEPSQETLSSTKAPFDSAQLLRDDPLLGVKPEHLHAVDFLTKEFTVGDKQLGSWSFKLRPDSEKVVFKDVRAELDDVILRGDSGDKGGYIEWLVDDKVGHRTRFKGNVFMGDLSAAFEHFGFDDPGVNSREAEFVADVWWQGSPAVVNTKLLNGLLDFRLKKGYFTHIASPSPALRLLNIFNFATYARRLSLDFSDFSDQGLSYDKVKGKIDFREGKIAIVDPITVESISSEIRMSGAINMLDETLDTKVVFTLPFSNNLPWFAALTGGLPAAAGVYVVTKIFKKQVDKFSSASYMVEGTWDSPRVELDQIFDNKDSRYVPPPIDNQADNRFSLHSSTLLQ